jgi:DNA-binding transcriptional MerR regulator/uncharacterized protein (DUF433 family)
MHMPRADVVIAAFSEEHVERLTGLSKSQLRYWDRTGFYRPSLASENRRVPYSRIYSFKDLLALRTIGVLRKQHSVPLQHLRKAAHKLSHLADELWTRTVLYVLNKKVIFHDPSTSQLREIVSDQYVIGIPLKTIVADTKRDVENMKVEWRRPDEIGRVKRSRFIAHNAWVIAGTRIPTGAIRRFKEAGYSVSQILKEYPDLTPQDIEAALAHEEKMGTAA